MSDGTENVPAESRPSDTSEGVGVGSGDESAQTAAQERDEETENLTAESDYRAAWLSTAWVLVYGFGFPAWVAATSTSAGFELPPGTLMAVLTLAWGGTVAYVIGPESIKAWKDLRGK